MCIWLVDEAWVLEVKKIATCPSFHNKIFLAHNVFLIFFIGIYNEINKSHSWFETSPFAWMYMYIQVQMYIFVTFPTLNNTHTDSEETYFKLGVSTQALTLMILHVDIDCVLW